MMSEYKVTSDRLVGHERGDVVAGEDLDGLNVEALVAAGHLAPNKKKTETKKSPPVEGGEGAD